MHKHSPIRIAYILKTSNMIKHIKLHSPQQLTEANQEPAGSGYCTVLNIV